MPAYGSAAMPVQLDPFREIVEVGWRKAAGLYALIDVSVAFANHARESCSPREGLAQPSSEWARSFIESITAEASSPADGEDRVLLADDGPGILCTASGFPQTAGTQVLDEWTYIGNSGTTTAPSFSGTSVAVAVSNLTQLDASPVCKGWGTFFVNNYVSAKVVGTTALTTSTLVDFSGATMTAKDGSGRVFHAVSAVLDHIGLDFVLRVYFEES